MLPVSSNAVFPLSRLSLDGQLLVNIERLSVAALPSLTISLS